MAAVIEVDVTLDTVDGVQEAVPHLPPDGMRRPQTVHYSTKVPGATVRIEFSAPELSHSPTGSSSPFLDANRKAISTIRSSNPPLALKNSGVFFCKCFLTLPGGKEIGWGPGTPLSVQIT